MPRRDKKGLRVETLDFLAIFLRPFQVAGFLTPVVCLCRDMADISSISLSLWDT